MGFLGGSVVKNPPANAGDTGQEDPLEKEMATHSSLFAIKQQWGFLGVASGKEPTCHFRRHKRHRFDPWVRKIPWRRKQQPTPVFLPGEFHGQRSLVGCSPWGCKRVAHDWATTPDKQPDRFLNMPLIWRHFSFFARNKYGTKDSVLLGFGVFQSSQPWSILGHPCRS